MKNRIGIVGGGQLGRMMTLPAKELGFEVTVIDPMPNCPAAQVGAKQIIADFTDEKAIKELAKVSDFLTFEIEHINTDVLRKLQDNGVQVNPSPKTLNIIKDKLEQKQFLQKAKIPIAQFLQIDNNLDALSFGKKYNYPFYLKSRFGGYDGRGNELIKNQKQIHKAMEKLGNKNLYAEQFVPFIKELAVMVARSNKDEIVVYPVVETIHKNNICHMTIAPARINKTIAKQAENLTIKVMKHLNGAGVFGIEMFLTKTNGVLVNEIAPRVHNSGHYTIEACITNQFEQHIRAITGISLGKTKLLVPAAVMINILGKRNGKAEIAGLEKVLKLSQTHVHIYGKHETRLERKMGHITVIDESINKAIIQAKKARKMISI